MQFLKLQNDLQILMTNKFGTLFFGYLNVQVLPSSHQKLFVGFQIILYSFNLYYIQFINAFNLKHKREKKISLV